MLHFRQSSVNAARGPRRTARVALAAALLWSVQAFAAPGVGDGSAGRGKDNVSSQPGRVVSGDPAQGNDFVAGVPWQPSAILAITPVPAKVGSYPPGTTIVGSELRAPIGGFRAWFEVQVSNWDPNRNNFPQMYIYQVKVDATGYLDSDLPGDQPDLAPAVVPCTTDAECVAAFGESWTRCESGKCKAGYVDKFGTGRSDGWCVGGCDAGDAGTANPNYNWFAVDTDGRSDQGIVYYGGTLVLDIPAGARGKYTVNLNTDETWPCYEDYVFCDNQQTLRESGFVVNILAGQCCFGLGTPDEGCVDGVLRSECDDQPGPVAFTPEGFCPPAGPDCERFLGACCDTLAGQCEGDTAEAACRGLHQVWTGARTCTEVVCTSIRGACCDTSIGRCEDLTFEAGCQGAYQVWMGGLLCADASCNPELGACCDPTPFVGCTDDVPLSDCRCASCTWHKLQNCAEIECTQTSIPTISGWGLAIMSLLLLTGAKIYFGRSKPTRRSIGFPGACVRDAR